MTGITTPKRVRPVITVDHANNMLQELTLIYLCAHVSSVASNELTGDFKSPVIHNKIKRITDDLQDVLKHIRNMPIFRELNTDTTDHVVGDFYQMMHHLIRFTPDEVKGFTGVVQQLVEEAESKMKETQNQQTDENSRAAIK